MHAFNLDGHAARAYVWSSPVEGSNKRRFYAVLHLGDMRWTRCGRLSWLRGVDIHDDVRPLQRHFSVSIQRDPLAKTGAASSVL